MAGTDTIAGQLVAAGRVAAIDTIGRATGRPARAAVGFVEEPDGSLLVAASSPTANWARNLLADPRCTVTIGPESFSAVAEPLERPQSNRAVRDLILKYGTPSESLGAGPVFRLRREA